MDQLINGRYRIIKLLGRGAFGSVYLAHDVNSLHDVVIKITNEPADDYESNAFEREVRTLARVSGPNIIGLTDWGTTKDGNSYIVREYLDGETLDRILTEADGSLDLVLAVRVALAVARGLRTLHQHGIIHRDVKPSNIIVPDNPDAAKLMDFGVVGQLQTNTNVTQAGQLFGTPLYMAPEQLRAEAQSPASDIYSLAATLYEMIYGKVPFAEESIDRVIFGKLAGELAFPANKAVPAAMLSFIRRCMSVAPEDRPQSADEVIEELSKFLDSDNYAFPDISIITDYDVPESHLRKPTVSKSPRLTLLAVMAVILATLAWLKWGGRYQVLGIAAGFLFGISGLALAIPLRHWLKARRSDVEMEAGHLLLSSKSKMNLSASLAIEVDTLISKVSRLDDRVLATSLAIMVKEFQVAREGQVRQAALMNVVQLLEKLTNRLSPWYVRHEKLIAVVVTAVGILSGVTTVAASIVSMTKTK